MEGRTTLYKTDEKGEVVAHQFPFPNDEKLRKAKLRRFEGLGYSLTDPREKAPLYISDKDRNRAEENEAKRD